MTSRPSCPCLTVAFMHLGGCFFAATMLGAAVRGIWGAVVGACLGLLFGALAAFSKDWRTKRSQVRLSSLTCDRLVRQS